MDAETEPTNICMAMVSMDEVYICGIMSANLCITVYEMGINNSAKIERLVSIM